jgi:histidine triad (HIT) family protein
MATLFTRIIEGDLPAHFVWRDERCVAFLSINPIRDGHTLVVPRAEVDHWVDLSPEDLAHVTLVARTIARSMQTAFPSEKVGLLAVGLEVPHVHFHLVPIDRVSDVEFRNQRESVPDEELAAVAERLREQLRADGQAEFAVA